MAGITPPPAGCSAKWLRRSRSTPHMGKTPLAGNTEPTRSPFVVTVLIVIAVPGVATTQASLPMVPGAHVVAVSPPGREEPTIAVNPKNPSQVLAAFQFPS